MKGILFKPDMIKAIIEGRKTQTRRIIKPQPRHPNIEVGLDHIDVIGQFVFTDGSILKPRYLTGETVYIKEAWYHRPDGNVSYKLDDCDAKPGDANRAQSCRQGNGVVPGCPARRMSGPSGRIRVLG